MIKKYFVPLAIASFLGFLLAIFLAILSSKPSIPPEPLTQIPLSPFETYVAGSGMVEPMSGEVKIGTSFSRTVSEVFVKVGSKVKVGDPLLKLESVDLQADYAIKQQLLIEAEAKYNRLLQLPRIEDVIVVETNVQMAEISLEQTVNDLDISKNLLATRVVSSEEVKRREYGVLLAQEKLTQLRAKLEQLKAGTWKPDLQIALAEKNLAKRQVDSAEIALEKMVIRSPIDGEVLQKKILKGELTIPGSPLFVLGNSTALWLRVEVDEHDAWRIQPNSPAIAYVIGNKEISIPLKFVRIEPYVVPKKSLTGDNIERIDTRVLQIIYQFTPNKIPIYVGQQMDVFISTEIEPNGKRE